MNQEPVPFKTDQEKPITEYSVDETGDVKIVQTVKTTSWWKLREFLSVIRQNESALEKTKESYSEEFIEKMKKQEKDIIDEIAIMTPVLQEAEKIVKADYEKQRHEGLKKNLLTALEDKEFNLNWWQNVWMRTKDEIKKPVYMELTSEQQHKVLKCVAKANTKK